MTRRPRVLFVGEAVSLAHATRPLVLANSLSPERWDVHLALPDRVHSLLDTSRLSVWPIETQSPERFAAAVRKPGCIFTEEILGQQVRQDLHLIEATSPDFIVSDFRLSLGISARIARIPLIALTNAVWSPHYTGPIPVPDLQGLGLLGPWMSQRIFNLTRGPAFRHQAAPYNRVRRAHGLGPVADIRAMHTDGDRVLYADAPSFVSLASMPPSHSFVGPILWEPKGLLPIWWDEVRTGASGGPWVYLTLGTSGSIPETATIARRLAESGLRVMVATGNKTPISGIPGVYSARFLPGIQACREASVVVCNGGSGTLYQALSAGKPVLAIASNLDQQLHGGALEASGAGIHMTSVGCGPEAVASRVTTLLSDASFRSTAERLSEAMANFDVAARFPAFLADYERTFPSPLWSSRSGVAPGRSGFFHSGPGEVSHCTWEV